MITKVSGVEAKDAKYRERYSVSKPTGKEKQMVGIVSFSDVLKEAQERISSSDNQNTWVSKSFLLLVLFE